MPSVTARAVEAVQKQLTVSNAELEERRLPLPRRLGQGAQRGSLTTLNTTIAISITLRFPVMGKPLPPFRTRAGCRRGTRDSPP